MSAPIQTIGSDRSELKLGSPPKLRRVNSYRCTTSPLFELREVIFLNMGCSGLSELKHAGIDKPIGTRKKVDPDSAEFQHVFFKFLDGMLNDHVERRRRMRDKNPLTVEQDLIRS